MLGHGLADILVDGKKGLARTPVPKITVLNQVIVVVVVVGVGAAAVVLENAGSAETNGVHLAYELPAKGVDDTRHGRSAALADEVEVEHSLHRPWLETAAADNDVSQTSRLLVRRRHPTTEVESKDVLDEASC